MIEAFCVFEFGRRFLGLTMKVSESYFYNYRIIYKLTNESILILGIIHAARDLNNMKAASLGRFITAQGFLIAQSLRLTVSDL